MRTKQDVEVGLLVDGVWVDAAAVGGGVLARDPIQIRRGRARWSTSVEPGQATFTLADRDGRWSPDYPAGPYAGLLRRNIPVRVGVGSGDPYLGRVPGSADVASTPDILGTGGGAPSTPVVASIIETSSSSFQTILGVTMPETVAVGDRLLLVAAFGHSSATHSTDLDAWTVLYAANLHGFHRWVVYELSVTSSAQATALSDATLDFTSTTACRFSAQVAQVTGVRPGGIGVSWAVSAGVGSPVPFSTAPDSPSLTAPWGGGANLFVSLFTAGSTGAAVTANPTGYTAGEDGSASAGVVVGSAYKASALATDNPGAFTINDSENWDALTIVYQPTEDASTDGVLDIAGDIDASVEFELDEDLTDFFAGGVPVRLAHKSSGSNGWEWELYFASGTVVSEFLWWDSSGVDRSVSTGTALPLSFQHDRVALRFTLDVDNGASGHTARFYTSDSVGGTWTQAGADHVAAGVTSIRTNDAPLRLAGNPGDLDHVPLPGKLYAFQLRDGIGGTIVANPDFTAQAPGASSFTDSAGRLWAVGAGGRVSHMRWRFHGELASLPTRWNTDGSDVWAPVEATGLFRRLSQGSRLLESAIRRAIIRAGIGVVQYWPMEEKSPGFTTRFGAAIGTAAMLTANGVPDTDANTSFLASASLPTLGAASVSVVVDEYPTSDAWQVRWLQHIPSGFVGTQLHFVRVETSDMVWEVAYRDTDGGQFHVYAYRGLSTVWTSGWLAFNANGKAWRMTLSVKQNGANVDVVILGQEQQGTTGGNTFAAAVAGAAGRVTRLRLNKDSDVGDWAFGHVTVQDRVTSADELATELNAYTGETAGARVQRLCREEGIPARIHGNPATTEAMGPQRPGTLIGLLQECADTDLGILHESMDSTAVAYRTRASMLNQTAAVALDYSAGEVAGPLELDRDDQDFANDVTVENWSGATARAALSTGAMSTLEPPSGAGRYDASYTVNGLDSRLVALATSRLALSAVDEPRVSSLKVALHHPALTSSDALTASVLRSGLGDLVTVDNVLPVALGAVQVRQVVQGAREMIAPFEHTIDMLTSPASPWADDDDGGTVAPPPAEHSVTFRSQLTLATPGSPQHVLRALGYIGDDAITRADLDGILDDWLASTGGTLRTVTSEATWATAMAAAVPGDLVRVTASFTLASGSLAARGNLYGISGSTMTASPAGGSGPLPIIVTSADGVEVGGSSLTNDRPVLDLVNCRHVWAVGFNVAGTAQFGIRAMNWGGTSGFPAYIAYCQVDEIRDAAIACQGWFQLIASSGGTPPSGAGNTWGFSEWFVVESNTVFDPNPGDVAGNPGEGVYMGRGASPGWISYAKDWWVRGNTVTNYKGNGYEAKPGCRRGRFLDNVAIAGRGSNGSPFEMCYQFSGLDTRPAHMNDIDGSGTGDIQIYVEGNRVYDYNITETGVTRNQAFIIGMAGVRLANNMLWSARDSAGNSGPANNMSAVLIQTEKTLADFGNTATQPTWVVNNNWQSRGLANLGVAGTPIAGVVFRNNIVPTGYDNGTHTAGAAAYIAATPAVGALADAEWETYGAGSAFDLDPGSALVGAGASISDLGLYIDADISGRPIPATPNPGPFQPFD